MPIIGIYTAPNFSRDSLMQPFLSTESTLMAVATLNRDKPKVLISNTFTLCCNGSFHTYPTIVIRHF